MLQSACLIKKYNKSNVPPKQQNHQLVEDLLQSAGIILPKALVYEALDCNNPKANGVR